MFFRERAEEFLQDHSVLLRVFWCREVQVRDWEYREAFLSDPLYLFFRSYFRKQGPAPDYWGNLLGIVRRTFCM